MNIYHVSARLSNMLPSSVHTEVISAHIPEDTIRVTCDVVPSSILCLSFDLTYTGVLLGTLYEAGEVVCENLHWDFGDDEGAALAELAAGVRLTFRLKEAVGEQA